MVGGAHPTGLGSRKNPKQYSRVECPIGTDQIHITHFPNRLRQSSEKFWLQLQTESSKILMKHLKVN